MFAIDSLINFPFIPHKTVAGFMSVQQNKTAPLVQIPETGETSPIEILDTGWIYEYPIDLEINKFNLGDIEPASDLKQIDINTSWFGNRKYFFICDFINFSSIAQIEVKVQIPIPRNNLYSFNGLLPNNFEATSFVYQGIEIEVVDGEFISSLNLPSGVVANVKGYLSINQSTSLGVVKIGIPPLDKISSIQFLGDVYYPLNSIFSIYKYYFFWHPEINYALLFVPLAKMRDVQIIFKNQRREDGQYVISQMISNL